jgi:hypothetical protein
MGWFNDNAPGHEGYLIANIVEDGRFVKVDEAVYWKLTVMPRRGLHVSIVQVECECGWRSPRLRAPMHTTWAPCIVLIGTTFREDFEAFAEALWTEHCRAAAEHTIVNGVTWVALDGGARFADLNGRPAAPAKGRKP